MFGANAANSAPTTASVESTPSVITSALEPEEPFESAGGVCGCVGSGGLGPSWLIRRNAVRVVPSSKVARTSTVEGVRAASVAVPLTVPVTGSMAVSYTHLTLPTT